LYEDNAGGLVITDGVDGWDVSGVAGYKTGREDLKCAAEGDTDGWNVPRLIACQNDLAQMELVASYEGGKLSYYDEDMGSAAREYLGFARKN
jgi:hypothetical protein